MTITMEAPSKTKILTEDDAIFVTPEMAEAWLKANVNNRPLQPARVADLVRALRSNQWRLTPDAICFDGDGCLVSGQHRLSAIVESGIAAQLFVVRLSHTDTVLVTDRQRSRTLGNILAIRGEKNANALSGVLQLLWRYERVLKRGGDNWGDARPCPNAAEVLEVLERNPFARDWAVFGTTKARKFPIQSGIVASLGAVFEHASSHDDAVAFWLGTFDPTTPDVRGVLSRRLLHDASARGAAKLPDVAIRKLVIKAWNSFATDGGRDVQRLNLGAAESTAFPVRLTEWSGDQV